MENLNHIIAKNLKQQRDDFKLSLGKVAELTGVSKSMLGQIERGESNPTIATVWKIANGLKISFTTLINTPQSGTVKISKNEVVPLVENNGLYKLYPAFPYEESCRFETYFVEIEKGGYLSAKAHRVGTEEFLTIFSGELTIQVNNEEYILHRGDSLKFKADKSHVYHNSGSEMVMINMVIYYSL